MSAVNTKNLNAIIISVDRARQSFRQSLRMSSFRGRAARQSGRLTPLPPDDEYDEESSSTHLKTPSTPKAPDSLRQVDYAYEYIVIITLSICYIMLFAYNCGVAIVRSKTFFFHSLKTAAPESVITSTTTARVEDETTSPQPLFVRPEPQVRFDPRS